MIAYKETWYSKYGNLFEYSTVFEKLEHAINFLIAVKNGPFEKGTPCFIHKPQSRD